MTTYKEGPVYAEVLLGMMDVCSKTRSDTLETLVLSSLDWKFKGGSMKEAAGDEFEVHEDTYFVDCSTRQLARYKDLMDYERVSSPYRRDYESLKTIMANRKNDRPMSKQVMYMRLGMMGMVLFDKVGDAVRKPMTSGLASIYPIYASVIGSAAVGKLDKVTSAYIREVTLGSVAGSNLDPYSAHLSCVMFDELLRRTPIVDLLAFRSVVERTMGTITGGRTRKNCRTLGFALEDILDDITSADMEELITAAGGFVKGADTSHGDVVFECAYTCARVRLNGKFMLLGISDLKRLSQMVMSTCSLLVAACAQACTGSPDERSAGVTMVDKMVEAISDMAEFCTKMPIGDEVKACKTLKKAFTVYMGIISGPMCREETIALRDDAMSETPVDSDIVDRWVARIEPLPVTLAFNVGKVYKILPAPDSAPGGVAIDRLKQTAKPNAIDEDIFAEFMVELTEQIIWGRMLDTKLPRLELKKGVAAPMWWGKYRSGETSVIETRGLADIVNWEGSTPMVPRSALDPSIWKDSGLGADTAEEGLSGSMSKYMKNMLLRMVFDKTCPMPGSELTMPVEEWVNKSDQKPESHKDPARSIFSAAIRLRFIKSYLEQTVGQTMRNHPAFVIGAKPAKLEERIRAAISPKCSVGRTPFYYSFDVAGWSPKMPHAVQVGSHDIWHKMTGDDCWKRADEVMYKAKVYFANSGYKGAYVNGEANFEGYDGKEMTMVNVAMLGLSVKRWRRDKRVISMTHELERDTFSALLMAYIDDGMARIELPFDPDRSMKLFHIFTDVCMKTFSGCGFTIEPSKCFPSDRFFIFLNEAYLAGRHLVHGVRAAGQICSLGIEKHESLIAVTDKVSAGVRGAVMAGLDPVAGTMLMAFHTSMHIREWVGELSPVGSALWTLAPRAWGGLGMPNTMQLGTTTSGHAHTEAIATFQRWASISKTVKSYFLNMVRTEMQSRTPAQILANPFSARVTTGYMNDTQIPGLIRKKLANLKNADKLSPLATQFLSFAGTSGYKEYANAVVMVEPGSTVQAQYLKDLSGAHPQSVFSAFCTRIERSATVIGLLGNKAILKVMRDNHVEARASWRAMKSRVFHVIA